MGITTKTIQKNNKPQNSTKSSLTMALNENVKPLQKALR
jgi:hypothetical protein